MDHEKTEDVKILIVDDDIDSLNILIEIMNSCGLHTFVATGGESAVEKSRIILPDLILLDIMMPGIDGIEVCKMIKAYDLTADIPVIFLTALSDIAFKNKCFDCGGVDFVTKPNQSEEVLLRVKSHLTISRLQKQLEEKNKKLEELNASKDKFFSILAHDIKSPLISFISFAEVFENLDRIGHDKMAEFTKYFKESAKNLYALFENLLSWAGIQQGRLHASPQEISLKYLVLKNIDLFKANVMQKEISVVNMLESEIYIYADFNMIDTVVRNLISNAVKFTKRGGLVQISAASDDGKVLLRISIQGSAYLKISFKIFSGSTHLSTG